MAMDAAALGTAIKAGIDGVAAPSGDPPDEAACTAHTEAVWTAVATAIIDHLKDNMELTGSAGIFDVTSSGGNVS